MAIDDTDKNLFGLVILPFAEEDVIGIGLAVESPYIVFAKIVFDDRQARSKVGFCLTVLPTSARDASKIGDRP
jgi:hypothetical protein